MSWRAIQRLIDEQLGADDDRYKGLAKDIQLLMYDAGWLQTQPPADLDSVTITDRQLVDALARRGYIVQDGVIDIDYGDSINYDDLRVSLEELEHTDATVAAAARQLDEIRHEVPFCNRAWVVNGTTLHQCLKRKGHDDPHTCCTGPDAYPGGENWTGQTYANVREAAAAHPMPDATS